MAILYPVMNKFDLGANFHSAHVSRSKNIHAVVAGYQIDLNSKLGDSFQDLFCVLCFVLFFGLFGSFQKALSKRLRSWEGCRTGGAFLSAPE